MPLPESSVAPNFALKDKDGKIHSLPDSLAIVYFYPKDNTSGCTVEALAFTQNLEKIKKLGAALIGISGGTEETKKQFCEKHHLTITLLSDPDFSVCKKYDVYGEKSFMGKKFLGIKRTTFIISQGKIIKIFENVRPEGHAEEVIAFLKTVSLYI